MGFLRQMMVKKKALYFVRRKWLAIFKLIFRRDFLLLPTSGWYACQSGCVFFVLLARLARGC